MSPPASNDADGAAEADDPGRPRRADELDPELIKLPRRRARIGPVLGASVVVLCVLMMWRLRADLAYSRADDAPRAVDPAAAATAAPETYVELTGRPDRVNALHVFPSRATDGHRLLPVLGTGGAVWVLLDGDPWDEAPATRERYLGRLRRLGDLPLYRELTSALAAAAPAPVAVDPAAVRAALGGGEGATAALRDPSGEAVPLEPGAEVVVRETVAGRARVIASAIESYPDDLTWAAALTRAGVLPSGTGASSTAADSFTFDVPAPAGVDGVAAALVAARLFATRVEPLVVERRLAWSELSATEDGLQLPGVVVPWTSLSAITVAARRPVPSADARVVVVGEAPGDYWYVLPIELALLVLGGVLVWGLLRALRAARRADAAAGA